MGGQEAIKSHLVPPAAPRYSCASARRPPPEMRRRECGHDTKSSKCVRVAPKCFCSTPHTHSHIPTSHHTLTSCCVSCTFFTCHLSSITCRLSPVTCHLQQSFQYLDVPSAGCPVDSSTAIGSNYRVTISPTDGNPKIQS